MFRFSLRQTLLLMAAFAVVAALTGRFGIAMGVMAAAILFFASILALGSSGDPRTMLGFVLSLLALFTFGDYAFALFVDWPSWLVGCGLIALAIGPFLTVSNQRATWAIAIGAAIWLGGLTVISDSPKKAFTRAYRGIRNGMSAERVRLVIGAEFPHKKPLANKKRDADWLSFTLDPSDGRYNAEVIRVELQDGRVVGKTYLPD